MNMLKKIALLALVASLGAVTVVSADQPLAAAVGNVDTAGNTLIGATIGNRQYSAHCADTGINLNQSGTCGVNSRCAPNSAPSVYRTAAIFNGGGYLLYNEQTGLYCNDAINQTFYNLIDAEGNPGTCNHMAFFAVQGQKAGGDNIDNPGDARSGGCSVTAAQNCYTRADSTSARATAYGFTKAQYPAGSGGISSVGGLSPVPVPRVQAPATSGCPNSGEARVTWEDPETYAAAMKNGVASPVLGVKLYKNDGGCGTCPSGEATNWTAVNSFPLGAGTTGVCVPVAANGTWFAMTVRVKGPSSGATELETGIAPGSAHGGQYVGANSPCVGPAFAVQIQNVNARYMGRATVKVDWMTGTESGVQGFYVQRSNSAQGPFTRVSDMVTPVGDGNTYTFSERVNAGMGKVLYYNVQVVNADGSISEAGTTAVTLPPAAKRN